MIKELIADEISMENISIHMGDYRKSLYEIPKSLIKFLTISFPLNILKQVDMFV